MVKDGKHIGWIYIIKNQVNSKIYIGQTMVSLKHRFGQHVSSLGDTALHKAMHKYGINKFNISPLEEIVCLSREELKRILNQKEKFYIRKYDSMNYKKGYNMTIGGDNPNERFKKCVNAYDKNGNLTFTTSSIVEMCEKTGVGYHVIIDCCKGITIPKTCEWIFRYSGDSYDKFPTKRKSRDSNSKRLFCFDTNGNFISEFKNAKEASRKINANANTISQAVRNKYSVNDKYYFSYENKFDYQRDSRFVAVDVYTLNGDYIGSFNCINDAFKTICPNKKYVCTSNVHKCCKGESPSAHGFVWRYKGVPLDAITYEFHPNHAVSIIVHTVDGNYIGTYESQTEASRQLGLDNKIISACLKKGKPYCGYVFSLS